MAKSLRISKIQHHILIPHPQISLGGSFQVHTSILKFQTFQTRFVAKEMAKNGCKMKISKK